MCVRVCMCVCARMYAFVYCCKCVRARACIINVTLFNNTLTKQNKTKPLGRDEPLGKGAFGQKSQVWLNDPAMQQICNN